MSAAPSESSATSSGSSSRRGARAAAGEIAHASEAFAEPAGGGAVAAVQLRRLAGAADFFTALGTGADAERADAGCAAPACRVHAGTARAAATRRSRSSTTTASARSPCSASGSSRGADPLPWDALGALDPFYFTGGDAGAVRAARAARVLVATPRALAALAEAGVQLDALVGSAHDPARPTSRARSSPEPRVVVCTRRRARAARGSERVFFFFFFAVDSQAGAARGWEAAHAAGSKVDAYGCGDMFAAALTYGLGAGMTIDAALDFAARAARPSCAAAAPRRDARRGRPSLMPDVLREHAL